MRRPSIAVLFGSFITLACGSDAPTLGASATETGRVGVATSAAPDDDIRAGTAFFIAPGGNDANPGTEVAPFQTLERARAAVRAALLSGTGPIRVWLREGTYRRTVPFELLPEDSGRPDRPITWGAYPSERAEITGLRRINGPWTPDSGIWSTPAQGLRFSTLFVNGARATRARTPNNGTYDMIVRPQCCNDPECPGGPPSRPPVFPPECLDRFRAQPGSVSANFRNLHDVEIVSRRRWEASRHHIERVDEATSTVFLRTETVDQPYGYDYDGTDRYYIENAFEALDQPGEWYLDAPADRLYYIPEPGSDPNQSVIEVPVTDELLRAGDVGAVADIVSEDLVVVPQSDDLRFGRESFTISLWLSMPASIPTCHLVPGPNGTEQGSASCVQPVLCRGDAFNATGYCVMVERVPMHAQGFVSLRLRDNRNGMLRSPQFELPPPTGSGDGAWTHFAWVVDREAGEEGQLRTYVGGQRVSVIPLRGGGPFGTRPLRDIGTWHDFAVGWLNGPIFGEPYRYEGKVDELHVVAGALTDAGVRLLYTENTQGEAPEPLHLDFESAEPTSEDVGRPIVMRGRLRTVPGAFPNENGAVFNEPPPVDAFAGYLENVTFRGLEFRGTDASLHEDGYQGSQNDHRLELPAAITLVTRHAAFTRGAVTGTGAAAIRVLGVDTEVSANEIRDTGSSGVEIGRLPPREGWTAYEDFMTWLGAGANLAHGVRVLGNRIHAVGRRFTAAAAVLVARNSENRIAGNRVYDTGHSGISAGWFTSIETGSGPYEMHDNVVEQNEISAAMGVQNDGGGVYILGRQPRTIVRNNVVHDIHLTSFHRPRMWNGGPHPDGSLLFGIYLDGTTAYVSVSNNVTYRIEDGGLILGSGLDPTIANHDNHVSNNVFVDGVHFQTFFLDAIHDTFERNIVYATHPPAVQAPFFYFSGGNMHPTLEHSDQNLWFRADGNYQQLEAWRKATGFDTHSLEGLDPLFIDPPHDDYRVPLHSPAVTQLGFVPITTHAGPPAAYCFEDSDCGGLRCIQRVCQ